MKFNKQMDSGALLTPVQRLRSAVLRPMKRPKSHALDSAVIVLKKQMTAMELTRQRTHCIGWPRSLLLIWPWPAASAVNARTAAPSTIWRRECWNCRTICGERHASLTGPSSGALCG